MPRPRAVLAMLVVLAVAACGDDPRPAAPGVRPSSAPATTTSAPAASKAGAPPIAPSIAPSIAPPAPPAPPPAKPQLTPVQFAALTTRDVPGFTRTAQRSGPGNAVTTFEGTTPNAQGYRLLAHVIVEHCTFCAKPDVAAWRANPNLRRTLPSAHLENPALVFEVDGLELAGRTGLAVYKESFVVTTNASGTTRAAAHGIIVWLSDGVHQLVIDVFGRGPARPGSIEEMRASLSRGEMEAAARAVFAAYADVF